jgi:LysM repeat protein
LFGPNGESPAEIGRNKFLFAALLIILAILFSSCATPMRRVSVVTVDTQEQAVRDKVDGIVEQEAPVKTEVRKYKVQKGDSLWSISKKLFGKGSLYMNIAQANGLQEPFFLRENRELIIPGEARQVAAAHEAKKFEYRTVSNKAFGVGEKLVFAVKYFNVTAGFGTLEVAAMEKYNNRDIYRIRATAITAPFFETFYRVHDTLESYMDVMGMFSWKYSKKLEEGGYRNNTYMDFYPEQKYAQKKDGTKCDTPSFVQDVLSEFYYFRAVFDTANKETYIDVASDECKSYQIMVNIVGYEKVTVDAGEFDCVIVQPHLKFEGIFKQAGDVLIWLTNDENRMPVLVKSKIAIGTIDAVLQSATVVKAK